MGLPHSLSHLASEGNSKRMGSMGNLPTENPGADGGQPATTGDTGDVAQCGEEQDFDHLFREQVHGCV